MFLFLYMLTSRTSIFAHGIGQDETKTRTLPSLSNGTRADGYTFCQIFVFCVCVYCVYLESCNVLNI